MPLSLSGSRLDDPKALRDDLLRQNLPVGEWAEKCNSFVSPCEREPGTGHLLIRRSEWDRIADKTSLTLTFIDHTGLRLSLVKLHPVSAPTPLAQEYNPRNPVLWLTLEDRRSRYRQVYVGRGYNLRLADGSWDTPTLNSGTPWTWAQVVADLWAKIRAVYTDLPSSPPSLPATPSGTPESFYFYSKDAWTALCDVCQAAGLLVKYDPTTDTTSIINPAGAAPAEPNVAKMTRTWDTGSGLLIPEAVPATVYVSYPRIGRSDYHQASAAITESGTTTGAAVVLGAYPAAAGDPVSNTTYLNAFAGRVRDFWRRDLAARSEPRRVQYRGHQSWVREAVGLGGYAAWSVAELAGGEVQTCLYSGPLMRLSAGDPLPAASGNSLNTQNTDGTEIDATTTDIRFNKTTGVQVTQGSGGTANQSIVTLISAGVSQIGAVTTTTQSFAGNKTFTGAVVVNGTHTVQTASGLTAIGSENNGSTSVPAASFGVYRVSGSLSAGFYCGYATSSGDGTVYAYFTDGMASANLIVGINPTNNRRGINFSGNPPTISMDVTWDLYKEGSSAAQPVYSSNDFEFDATGIGPIVRSPNGNRWRLTVSNAGVVSATGPL